jgi:acetyl-CoA carboxylase carboxyltransferase component
VPLVTAVLGASAGHGALVAPMSDFAVMSSRASVFTAGPPVVLESLGEQISKEDLGGPDVALASGLIHNVATDDVATLGLVRTYLRYFPSSAWSYPLDLEGGDDGFRPVPELLDIIPLNGRRVYDMHEVVDVVFDEGSCFEVQPEFGRSVLCLLARLGGHPVAVVANQPQVLAGALDSDGADKAAHFITVADSFHLPIIFLADNPGVMPGSQSERAGMVMGMIPFDGQSATFAFPGTTMGAMGAAAMSRARGSDVDEAALLRQLEVEASYRSAGSFGQDELISPVETRDRLLQTLDRALYRRQATPEPAARIAITP